MNYQKILNYQLYDIISKDFELFIFGKEWVHLTCRKDNEPNTWWQYEQSVVEISASPHYFQFSSPSHMQRLYFSVSFFGQWNSNKGNMHICS